jgi:biotin carboxyl carrier protein
MRIDFKLAIAFTLVVTACSTPATEEDSSIKAKVSVEITGLSTGVVKDELTLFANTLYLKRNVVTSPIPAFITQVFIKLGEPVKEGQVLYLLETKERRALGTQAVMPDSSSTSYGKISVKAPASGIVSTLDKQQIGDYVLEGSQLCTIAESNALAFAVNVPFEFSPYAKTGVKCMLLLPDNSVHAAHFTTPLTTMNALAQTQTILAKSDDRMFLPENLIVKVLVNKNSDVKKQILPKMAMLSDEMMEKFWVMKLINDSTAIKVDVKPGTMNKELVEIMEPLFKVNDKFLVSGNYGLPDTAFVRVNH